MAVLSVLVFAGAMLVSMAVIAAAVGPQWRRILSLATGRAETGFAPLRQLAQAERRIAVRRWANVPATASAHRLREVA